MRNLACLKKHGFAIIQLLLVLLLIAALYFMRPYFSGSSKSGQGYIEHQIAVKHQAEAQVKSIQDTLKKRYQG